jgi:hypothetical protein
MIMADQKIVEYVKASTQKGKGIDEIRQSLLSSGWPEDQVSAGIAEASADVPKPGPVDKPAGNAPAEGKEKEKKGGRKKLIVAIVILIIVAFLFLYVAAELVTNVNEWFPEGMQSINDILAGGGA